MHVLMLISLVTWTRDAEPTLDFEPFSRLVQGAFSDIRDLSFDYEGSSAYTGPKELIEGPPDHQSETYEGRYTWRNDGSKFLEMSYRKEAPEHRLTTSMYAINRTRPERATIVKDFAKFEVTRLGRDPLLLNILGSPERINFLWVLDLLPKLSERHYRYLGWEDVNGHRCLKVELDLSARAEPTFDDSVVLWFDLERGCHPLRASFSRGGQIYKVCKDIRLKELMIADARKLWLPVAGITETYRWEGINHFPSPAVVETYNLIQGTVQLNTHPEDSFFLLRSRLSGVETGRVRPDVKTNVDERRLDQAIAEARQQIDLIEAKSPARTSWRADQVFQVVCVTSGILIFAVLLFLKVSNR